MPHNRQPACAVGFPSFLFLTVQARYFTPFLEPSIGCRFVSAPLHSRRIMTVKAPHSRVAAPQNQQACSHSALLGMSLSFLFQYQK